MVQDFRMQLAVAIIVFGTVMGLLPIASILADSEMRNRSGTEVIYTNERFSYLVQVPKEWYKVFDTSDYVFWLTPEALTNKGNHSTDTGGAKFAITALNNPGRLSVEEWLVKYSGDDFELLLEAKSVLFGDRFATKYTHGRKVGDEIVSTRQTIYLPIGDSIFSFAVFYPPGEENDYIVQLDAFVNSFRYRPQVSRGSFVGIAYAASIPLYAPWNAGDYWIAGSGCYPGGNYYATSTHTGSEIYAVDFNGVLNANCQLIVPDDGKEIRAVNAGTVLGIGQNPNSGFGYYVLLDHGNGVTSRYAHLQFNPTINPEIQFNQLIAKGQIIGFNGSTGLAFGAHLHFSLYQNGTIIMPDPMDGQSLCSSCSGALILSSNTFSLPAVTISSNISSNTTWTAGNVYVIQNSVSVNSGVTLTIQPGAIVKFAPGTLLTVNGILNAVGAAANKIYFTSLKDDAVGGDTNGDGSATQPNAADYQGIRLNIGSLGTLKRAVLRYGGSGFFAPLGALKVMGGSAVVAESAITNNLRGIHNEQGFLTLATSTVSSNQNYGVYVSNAGLCCWTIAATVTGTAFANNALGDGYFAGDMNFVNFGNTTSGTTTKGFFMNGPLAQSGTWNPGVPFVINSLVAVSAGKTLQVNPGTVVKFKQDQRLDVYGTLVAKGATPVAPPPERLVPGAAPTPAQSVAPVKVFFTSFKDDAAGGDTNGDGSATLPAPADYGGVFFYSGSTGAFETAVARYGGACAFSCAGYGVIRILGGSVTVRASEIVKNNYGIHQTGGSLAVATSTVRENLNYGIFASNTSSETSTTTIVGSQFGNNTTGDAYLGNNLRFAGSGNTTDGTTTSGFWRAGTVFADETWNPGVPFVIESALYGVTVPVGKTLTISPGVIVKFNTNAFMNVSGILAAGSQSANQVYFTSLKDDTVGGDTNGDGGVTAPAPQDYQGITFQNGSNGSFTSAVLRYGGGGPCCGYGIVRVEGGTVNISNSEISKSYYGIFQNQGALTLATSVVRDNASYGIYVYNQFLSAATSTIANSTFGTNAAGDGYFFGKVHLANTGNATSGTTTQGFWLNNVMLPSSAVWNPGVPYVIKAADVFSGVTVPAGRMLTIAPGTAVKFQFGQLTVNGTLTALGTALDKIYFTSIKDDTVAGDTNGDGNAATPAPGDYVGIVFTSGSTGTFAHTVMRYGGYFYFGGVVVVSGGNASIANSRFHLNDFGLKRESGAMTVTQSSIHANNNYGLSSNTISPNVSATLNWWGSPLGPFHATLNNATGTGNSVSNNVDFIPWLLADPN